MEVIEKYKWLVVTGVAVIALGGLLVINSNETVNIDSDDKTTITKEEKTKKDAAAKAEEAMKMEQEASHGTNTYTARAGDSYTVLARKAVQAYAKDAGTNVSRAQIIAAETFLTQDANAPLLEIGQNVTLDKSVVSKAVKSAQALTSSELAAWQVYVPYVNFDTTHNG